MKDQVCVLLLLAGAALTQGRAAEAPPPAAQARQAQQGQRGPQENTHRATKEQLEGWMTELSNWGRWGPDDQFGALNLITPAKRMQAAALIETGTVVSLSHNFLTEQAADAPQPFGVDVQVNGNFARDRLEIDYHGTTHTHIDAFCHFSYEGKHFNGFDVDENISAEGGCSKLGIAGVKDKIFTRAILIDIPRLKGVPYLEPGAHVYAEDIEAWEEQAGVRLGPGDALLLRTGRWARRAAVEPFSDMAGFDASIAPFLKERDIALLGSDAIQDVGIVPGFPAYPVHHIALITLGVNIFDNLDLEAAAETAARMNRWEFLLVAAPVSSAHSTGSPISPVAVF